MYKYIIIAALLVVQSAQAQVITGRVLSKVDSSAIEDVRVFVNKDGSVPTNKEGEFSIRVQEATGLITFSHMNFITKRIPYPVKNTTIYLEPTIQELQEVVVSTGYYEVPVEKLTGSFSHVSNQDLNLHASTNIMERLENVSTSIQFDRRRSTASDEKLELRVRGLSTIYSDKSPLIVLDNFPYYGDINSIDPNDIEDITILKDAAAASIWGAKAGNGVIVIKSKQGKKGAKPTVTFSSGTQLKNKPDIFSDRSFLPSKEFIEVERSLFSQEFYKGAENSSSKLVLSPVVELLIAQRDGLVSAEQVENQLTELSTYDVRRDINQYLYNKEQKQHYSLTINGGGERVNYYLSAGHYSNLAAIQGRKNNRTSVLFNNQFRPIDKLELSSSLNYTYSQANYNSVDPAGLTVGGGKEEMYPYARLADENGNPLAVVKGYRWNYVEEATTNGLLDWFYRPLDEIALSDRTEGNTEIRLNNSIKYSFFKGLNLEVRHQYQKGLGRSRYLDDKDSYYARDLVNKFTQTDGKTPLPYGDILRNRNSSLQNHIGRAQLDYQNVFYGDHQLFALSGMEISTITQESDGSGVYGYDDDVLTFTTALDFDKRYPILPAGSSRIGSLTNTMTSYIDKNLSYYGNVAYSYSSKYFASFSARWDASNLFGVKTNQKGVPLWSAGFAWNLAEEKFMNSDALSHFKLRVTYGVNGNTNKSSTAFTTAKYNNDTFTSMRAAEIVNPGNPSLRWEKVKIWNWGLDFGLLDRRISGKIDFYTKNGVDLLGRIPMNPTSGFPSLSTNVPFRVNYADIVTKGLDVELNYRTRSRTGANWNSSLFLSHSTNKVKAYKIDETANIQRYAQSLGTLPPVEGLSMDGFYSFPWYGLDPSNGNPMVLLDDELTSEKDAYNTYIKELEREDLAYAGLSLPPVYGSFRNAFNWKNWTVNAMLSFKFGYYFRNNSLDYTALFDKWKGHVDYKERWQKPGDEATTNVPSMPLLKDNSVWRDMVYLSSEALVEKGDHIRLHDINLGYSLQPFRDNTKVNISAGIRELGILWRANKVNVDPDYPSVQYRSPKTFYGTLTLIF